MHCGLSPLRKDLTMTLTRWQIGVLSVPWRAGCASDEHPLGTLDIPLTASGPGGSSYRLADGLHLGADRAAHAALLPLHGGTHTRERRVPGGTCTATFRDVAGVITAWPLEHTTQIARAR
jgi:hypothetical protein